MTFLSFYLYLKVKTPGRNSIKRNRDFLASHDFQKKNAVGVRERCGICDKKIKFGKSCVKCLGCGLVCHPECKSEAFASACIQEICTPDNLFTPLMASSATGNTVPHSPVLSVEGRVLDGGIVRALGVGPDPVESHISVRRDGGEPAI